jgi:hypothetical protein
MRTDAYPIRESVKMSIHTSHPASWVITSFEASEILSAAWSFSIRTSDNYLLQTTPPARSNPLHFSFICPTTGFMKRSFRLGFAIVIKSCDPIHCCIRYVKRRSYWDNACTDSWAVAAQNTITPVTDRTVKRKKCHYRLWQLICLYPNM